MDPRRCSKYCSSAVACQGGHILFFHRQLEWLARQTRRDSIFVKGSGWKAGVGRPRPGLLPSRAGLSSTPCDRRSYCSPSANAAGSVLSIRPPRREFPMDFRWDFRVERLRADAGPQFERPPFLALSCLSVRCMLGGKEGRSSQRRTSAHSGTLQSTDHKNWSGHSSLWRLSIQNILATFHLLLAASYKPHI